MIELRHARVEFLDWGCVSWFADGASYGAHPHDTPEYREIAARCGYGDDVLAYAREHEVCHHLIGEELYGVSRVLWPLAHGREPDRTEAAGEEALAMMAQRWIRAGERPMVPGLDWDGLKRRAVELLG